MRQILLPSFRELQQYKKHGLLFIIGITMVAGVLRLYRLGAWSFWIDEIYTLRDSLLVAQTWGSLSLLTTSLAIHTLGAGEWQARLAPALIGVLTIPALYYLIHRFNLALAAPIAILLLAIAPWHVYWSQNARFYALLFLVYTAGLLLFFRALEQDKRGLAALAAILLTIALSERLSAFIFVPVIVVYLFSLRLLRLPWPAGLNWRTAGWLLLPIIFIGVTEAIKYTFGARVASVEQITAEREVTRSTIEVFLTLFVGNPGVSSQWLINSIVESIGIPIVILALFTSVILIARRDRFGLFLSAAAFIPIILMVLLSFFSYVLDRYLFITFFFWILLAAIGLQRLLTNQDTEKLVLGLGVLALFIIHPLAQNVYYFKYEDGARSNWKAALMYIAQHRQAENVPLFIAYSEIADYYLNQQENVYHIDETTTVDMGQFNGQVWFVDSGWLSPESEEWLRQNARLTAVFDTYTTLERLRMRVYLYEPK